MMLFSPSKPPTLRVLQPTATTISFTVSTRSPKDTLTARLVHYLSIIVRVLLAIAVLLLSWTKWRLTFPLPPPQTASSIEVLFLSTPAGQSAAYLTRLISWRWLSLVEALVLWTVLRKGYTKESLLVLRGLGIQTSTSSPTYLSTSTTRFIPTNMIQDIFIHEAFKGFEVRFYLAVVVEGEEEAVVVFPNVLPKRAILEEVWRGAKACLYEPKR
ncbi:hypothetical protein LTR16_000458 [Cryomyces antarcticus]|uniref:Phosphatidylinositol N-acetylglucosaminyltransferase subunit H conserved domain-containing protein n=1 Tax=Cryomyces antarcticus TaxID=329879 RepID=A0ABR0M8V8_9PEZI|nr:hypothetical protein LTR39_000483 [Cryomyces antarcticus]KAK5296637.1 hypothetical protein LTR16_000458 [Cryomyces antarcticus]